MKLRGARLHLLASRTHKWLAIIIGIQLLLWFASGALMSFLPIDRVHGDHLVDRSAVETLAPDAAVAPPSEYIRAAGEPVTRLSFRTLLGRSVAEVETSKGTQLFDAAAHPLPLVGAADAQRIVSRAWRGPHVPAASVEAVQRRSTEYRGALPAWRVALSDPDRTRVYVDARTGRITATRTGTWRLYDFFWGLHIMDWGGHENFNTPWLLAFALCGIALWLGGAVLLYVRWPVRKSRSRRAVRG